MTTERQAEANRANSMVSTGPKTATGKEVVARNATKHGVYSALPVIHGVERVEDWQEHYDGILASLAPIGMLETRLAERVALYLWRLIRVTRYEVGVIELALMKLNEPRSLDPGASTLKEFSHQESIAEQLAGVAEKLKTEKRKLSDSDAGIDALRQLGELADDASQSYAAVIAIFDEAHSELPDDLPCPWVEDIEFLAEIGVPDPGAFDSDEDWTTGLVRRGLELIARKLRVPPEELATKIGQAMEKNRDAIHGRIEELAADEKRLKRQKKTAQKGQRNSLALPDDNAASKIMRYEAHLTRNLFQTKHELERLQAARAGQRVSVPVAGEFGVTVAGKDIGTGG